MVAKRYKSTRMVGFLVFILATTLTGVSFAVDRASVLVDAQHNKSTNEFIVTWAVDEGYFIDNGLDLKVYEGSEVVIEFVLNHPQNWGRAGDLSFQKIDNLSDARIAIRLASPQDIIKLCNNIKDAVACAYMFYWSDVGYVCNIYVPPPVIAYVSTPFGRYPAISNFRYFFSILNHEVGHCLGLGHGGDKGDLMYHQLPSRIKSITFPNDTEIELLRNIQNSIRENLKGI